MKSAAGNWQQAAGRGFTIDMPELDSGVRSYRGLNVWQEAMNLAEKCYRLVAAFPKNEMYEISAQMRRAAVSIPSSIAEGYARESAGSYSQFLKISRGSLRELETQLLLADRVGLTETTKIKAVLEQCDVVARLLHGLIKSIQSHSDT